MPNKTKYRKQQKCVRRMSGVATSGSRLAFGGFGLKSLEGGRLSARQIEAARRVIARCMNRTGKIWIRVFPDVPVTKKPIEVRMGKGKGSVELWVFDLLPGKIIFEVDGVTDEVAVNALAKASCKLPFKTKILKLVQGE